MILVGLLLSRCSELNNATQYSHSSLNYVEDIQPIFQQNCVRCHGYDQAVVRGGLYLTNYDSILARRDRILFKIENSESENMYMYLNSPDDAVKIRDWIEIDNMVYE